MAYAAVSFLLENVSHLLNLKIDLISGAEEELQLLKNELDLLRAFLGDAANKPKEEGLLFMEREMKNVVYDAEDTIDSCLTMAATSNKSSRRRGINTKPVNLAEEVRSLREDKVKPMLDLFAAQVQNGAGSGRGLEEPWTIESVRLPFAPQHHVVGFEDEEDALINHLMEHTVELDVISIIGMPGLGKTTLARKIYQNPKIQFEFPIRIWVYVSQEFNRKDVFLNILKQLTSQDMSSLSDLELAQTVHESLKEGKFLLVLDDVWSVEDWNGIRDVLPKTNRMSKVLITSRSINIGWHANYTRDPHKLRFLTEIESWELLQLEVFGNLGECPQELQGIGKSIATECEGLPLAITVIGGILAQGLSSRESMSTIINKWTKVSKSVNMYLKGDTNQRISDIMELSYSALPDDLKDCFLYLGVIPEDYEISAWTLTRLWIAEGFIQLKEGQSLEETAETNLKDLIHRNLVMACKRNSIGEVKTCLVHDLIRSFCISKAAITEQNLFQEMKMPHTQMHRRLCIHSHLPYFLSINLNGPQVRSILCFYKKLFVLHPEYISAIPNAFKLLRVLESKSIKFTKFPMKFTRLIHLRYFTLSCDDLDVLPEAISQLWNLQILVVETESPSFEVKANIWKMIQLRHFKTKTAIILAVQGEGNASENLQTLSRLSPESCTEEVLNRVRYLKRLGIRGQLTSLIHTKCLGKLDRLEKLKLVNDLFYESTSRNWLHGLPSPSSLPPHLKRLTLSATFLNWEHMSILGKIDTLKALKLKNNAFTGSAWRVDGPAFPHLEFLLISYTNLVHWEVSTDSFQSLRCLVLENCEKLEEIPVGLAKSLEILEIERLNKYAVASAKKIEEEKKLMQGQQTTEWMVRFKLSIGIGCEGSPIDQADE